jgi:hypothetical protein
MVNKRYFIVNHLACRRDTKDHLSPFLSLSLHRQPSLFTQANNHDVKPSRGCSSLTTRPIRLLNPLLSSPHHQSSLRRLPPTDLACFCPPLAVEVSSASRHPLAAPCTFGRGCTSSCFPPSKGALLPRLPPSIWWVGTIICTAEFQRRQQDPQATLCTSRGGWSYPRVSTINGAIVYLILLFSCLVCYFDLISFHWLAPVFWLCWWICCMKVSLLISSLVSIEFRIVVSGFSCFMSWLV